MYAWYSCRISFLNVGHPYILIVSVKLSSPFTSPLPLDVDAFFVLNIDDDNERARAAVSRCALIPGPSTFWWILF